MLYCKNCGRLITPDARFCEVCGTSVNSLEQPLQPAQPTYGVPPPPPPPPDYCQQPAPPVYQPQVSPQQAVPPQTSFQQGQERAVGAIPLRKTKSLGRYDSWTAVITNFRIIFAQTTNEMTTHAASQAKEQAKADGKGFWGQYKDQLKGYYNFSQRYVSMDPNASLAETPGNFAVDNSGIREIKIHTKDEYRGGDYYRSEYSVEIKSAQGTYEFRMDENSQATNLLKQVYGERVKMPFGHFTAAKGPVQFKICF